jgi:hypothetical protein
MTKTMMTMTTTMTTTINNKIIFIRMMISILVLIKIGMIEQLQMG